MYENVTVIDVVGNVISTCQNPQGIVIVDYDGHKPIMTIEEVGDDEVVNLFIDVCKGTTGIIDNMDPSSPDANGGQAASRYELLVNIKDLKDEFERDFTRA